MSASNIRNLALGGLDAAVANVAAKSIVPEASISLAGSAAEPRVLEEGGFIEGAARVPIRERT